MSGEARAKQEPATEPADPGASASDHPLIGDLTEPQRRAVTTTEGPLLVMAAAGSGKTRVITRRVAWLVREVGIPPWQVLAITFTNKAAGEMRDRVGKLVTERQARALTLCTFHSLCVRILREFGERIGVPPQFSIYDTADQKRAIKQAMQEAEVDPKNFTPDKVLGTISNAKNELIDADAYRKQPADFYTRIVARVYQKYEAILRANQAMDFDDLLLKTAHLLRTNDAARAELQDRYQYLLIDEYQDTNHAQFTIAHCIAANHQNICVVGDPDQSIYGWRGANIRNILEFEQHYPGATVIALGQNYRSTPQILQAADALIRHNQQRRHKPLFTENAAGEMIRVVQAADEEHEAEVVVDWLKAQREAGRPWSDMAVFYRINALSRVMEDMLMRSSIPYVIARGTAFYQRKEVRDAIAYLRVLANPEDEIGLLRIINTPTRGIGDTTISHLRAFAAANGLSLFQTLEQVGSVTALNSRAANAVRRFRDLLHKWRRKIDTAADTLVYEAGMRDLVEMVVRDSGLEAHYEKEDEEKLANLYELVSAAQRFDEEYGEQQSTLAQRLQDYLESVALVADVDALDEQPAETEGAEAEARPGVVTLMTLHAAKGLEFPAVAMIGLEEGLLPHSRARDDPNELEEERRLCFVGITRAQQKLMLSHARYRTIRGLRERTVPSPFLRELPKDVIEEQDLSGYADTPWADEDDDDLEFAYDAAGRRRARRGRAARAGGRGSAELPTGTRIRHPQFGEGSVLAVSGAGPSARAKIHFDRVGVKTLILEYARLEKV